MTMQRTSGWKFTPHPHPAAVPLDKEVSPTSLSEGGIAELLILVEFDNLAEQAVWQRLADSLAG